MGRMSRQKGKRGEREAAKALEQVTGAKARRGQQFSGLGGKDVECDISGVHIEVKYTESFSLYAALEQAIRDAKGDVPVVLHRRNKKPWVVVVPMDQLLRLSQAIVDSVNQQADMILADGKAKSEAAFVEGQT